jgi:hypothetical protein
MNRLTKGVTFQVFWSHFAASAALANSGLRLWTKVVKRPDFR